MPVVPRTVYLLFIVAALASGIAGQRLALGPKPEKASVANFPEAFCSAVTGGLRVCKVRTSEDGDADFAIAKGDEVVARTKATAWRTIYIEPESFFAYRGDLDNDGSAEVVIVSLENVSNGLGVSYSQAYIFGGSTLESGGKPVSFSIQEFGPRENFIFDPATRRTEILISYWGEYSTLEPKRIPGVYLIGKWFSYRNGRLEPVLQKPTLARRLLNSFASERVSDNFENRRPYTWLRDRRALKFLRDPAEKDPPVRTETGTIAKVVESPSAGDADAELEISVENGSTVKAKLSGDWDPDERKDGLLEVKAVGIWANRYLYPLSWNMKFQPSVYLDRVEGRRVRLEVYKKEYGGEFGKLWLLD